MLLRKIQSDRVHTESERRLRRQTQNKRGPDIRLTLNDQLTSEQSRCISLCLLDSTCEEVADFFGEELHYKCFDPCL